jgi:ABC-type uncharacterized transport system involved in gliding motility auxiliary subunit
MTRVAGDDKAARGRGLLRGTTLGAGVLLVAALLVLVNYFGWKYWKRFDWTSSKLYSLSDKSKGVLGELDSDIEVVVFMTPGSQLYVPVTELLSRYEAASSRIKVRTLDAERNPVEARRLLEQYDVQTANVVVFSAGEGERRAIEEADLAEYDYSGMQMGQAPQIREFKGEQMFTGAILEMVEQRKPKILFTTGHGEAAPDDVSPRGLSQAQDLVGRDNFAVETWSSLGQDQVPAGTDLVVVAGPQVGFLEPELQALTRYLIGGGRVLLLLDPVLGASGLEHTGFGPWLEGYGVELGDDIVVDPANPLPFYSAETFFANQYDSHPITEALEDANYPVIFSLARSVATLPQDTDAGLKATQLVRSSPDAWGETDLVKLDEVAKDDADVPGPVGLGVAVELEPGAAAPPTAEDDGSLTVLDEEDRPPPAAAGASGMAQEPPPGAGEAANGVPGAATATAAAGDAAAETKARAGRLVVFGDSDFASNAQLGAVGNPTLLLNALNWLVERENLLAIPAKKADQIQLNLTRRDLGTIYLIVLAALPLASLSVGLAVYLRRRR